MSQGREYCFAVGLQIDSCANVRPCRVVIYIDQPQSRELFVSQQPSAKVVNGMTEHTNQLLTTTCQSNSWQALTTGVSAVGILR